MLSQCNPQVVDVLRAMPEDQRVRVVVRSRGAAVAVESPDPKSFRTASEYRAALIRRQQQGAQPGRSAIEKQADVLGLSVYPASTLQAVALEGSSGQVLRLLEQVDVESVLLEQTSPVKLPRPR